MVITLSRNYPDLVGRRQIWAGYGNGPANYNPAVGDQIYIARYANYIDACNDATSLSGNYRVTALPSAVGNRATWTAFWFYSGKQGVGAVTIAVPGSGQTNGTYNINGTGGGGAGAVAQVVIAGGAITSATLLSGGAGYSSAPNFNVQAGGTAGTLFVVVTPAGGSVPAGVNLSGEQVQMSGFGGIY